MKRHLIYHQDIQYPTDLNLLSDSREKLEELIDFLYKQELLEYHDTISKVYEQQLKMYKSGTHSLGDRIVIIHQSHVRPIVRGKDKECTEFGANLNLSLVNGYSFVDHLKWDAYNEGVLLKESIRMYYWRLGYWPKEVMEDRIYRNRENRNLLKEYNIRLLSKPLGRPPAVKLEHLSPEVRNPIEGKFGQAKTRFGMDRIKACLKGISESWIAFIALVLNMIKLAGRASSSLIEKCLEMAIQFFSLFQNHILFQ